MEKPFFLFAGHDYYPSGGAYDFIGLYATLEEAKNDPDIQHMDWIHIAIIENEQMFIITRRGNNKIWSDETPPDIERWA